MRSNVGTSVGREREQSPPRSERGGRLTALVLAALLLGASPAAAQGPLSWALSRDAGELYAYFGLPETASYASLGCPTRAGTRLEVAIRDEPHHSLRGLGIAITVDGKRFELPVTRQESDDGATFDIARAPLGSPGLAAPFSGRSIGFSRSGHAPSATLTTGASNAVIRSVVGACMTASPASRTTEPATLQAVALLLEPVGFEEVSTAPDANSALAFLLRIYAHYRYPGGDHWSDDNPWSGLDDANAAWIFDPSTLQLMRDNERFAKATGYEGALDWDPFCACQDSSPVHWFINVHVTGATTARAVIRGAAKPITIKLVMVNGSWRIHDILEDGGSIRADYIRDSRDDAAQLHVPYRP